MLRLWLWLAALGMAGCLEQVTGEPTALDPRFIAVATDDDTGGPGHASVEHVEMEHQTDDTGGPSHEDIEHVDVAPPQPFEDIEGEKVLVSGTVVALLAGAVELDVSRIDEDFPGGQESQGKLLFDEPGAFELQVPRGIGPLSLAAFQDPDQDGPGEGDFYAEMTIDVGDEPVMDLELILSIKSRANRDTGGPLHTEVDPPQPFEDVTGEKVLVSGTVVASMPGAVELDVSRVDKEFAGGRDSQGKLLFDEAGAFELQVPKGIGPLCLVAFQDPDLDGPGEGDFYAEVIIDVGDEPLVDLVLTLSTQTRNTTVGGPLHAEVGPPQPFEDVDGEKVYVSGTVVSMLSGAVELDISRVDEEFPGGRESKGKLLFDDAGDFEFQVPRGIGPLCLVAFQDPDLDGPGEGDFYAEVTIDVDDESVMDIVLTLSTEGRTNAGGGPTHTEVGPPQPFEDVEGEKVLVSGTVVATVPGAVDIDVSRVDPDAPGGRESHGKMLFESAGDFELQVPKGLGQLCLVAFQDPDLDGPGEGDFYAEMTIDVGDEPVTGLIFTLSKDARTSAGGGPLHTEAPPGFGSDEGPQPNDQPSTKDPFAEMEGERVSVQGTVVFDGDAVVDLDLFQPDASVPGGRTLLGKLKISSGPFTLQVPRSLGALELDAFADKTGDGPSADDPRGQVSGIDLTAGDVSGVQLTLEALTEEPPDAPPKGGGTDLEEEFARIGAGGGEATSETEGL